MISFIIENTANELFMGSSYSKNCADHPVLLQKGKFLQPDGRVGFLPPPSPHPRLDYSPACSEKHAFNRDLNYCNEICPAG